jgi:hypothetical protein
VSVIAVPEPISVTENELGHASVYGTVYVRTAGESGGMVPAAFPFTLSWNCPLPSVYVFPATYVTTSLGVKGEVP